MRHFAQTWTATTWVAVLTACSAWTWGCASPTAGRPAMKPAAAPMATQAPACELGSPNAALPDAGHAQLMEKLGTGLDPYRFTGGAWLGDQPLLLNEPFDFAVAMSLQGIGPAIAASKRTQANEAKARALAELRLHTDVLERLARLRSCGVHVYGVLWGTAEASSLEVVVDEFQRRDDKLVRVQHRSEESHARPLQGKGGWTAAALEDAFRQALTGN